jgi:peptidoglycan hydrolase CwlO-like protein
MLQNIFNQKRTCRTMHAPPNYGTVPRPFRPARMNTPILLVLGLLAFAVISSWAIYASIPLQELPVTVPVQEPHATAPNEDAQAIRDLRASQHLVVDELKALQETLSSAQAETKRLSGEVTALNNKLEALQQSFASTPQAQPAQAQAQQAEPAKRRRRSR